MESYVSYVSCIKINYKNGIINKKKNSVPTDKLMVNT